MSDKKEALQPIVMVPATQAQPAGTSDRQQALARFAQLDTIEKKKNYAAELIKTGLVPKALKTPEAVVGVILMGQELDFEPMTALTNIHSIDGRPTLSVHAIGALLERHGIAWSTKKDCVPIFDAGGDVVDYETEIHFYKKWNGQTITEVMRFTYQMADKAGWASKSTWVKMLEIMMYNRCFAIGARRVAPKALLGMYETSEWADVQNVSYSINDENQPVPEGDDPQWLTPEK